MMRPDRLSLLGPGAKALVTEPTTGFLDGTGSPDFSSFITSFDRPVSLDPTTAVLEYAMQRKWKTQSEVDAWLAPRLYACLRLTPREAADRRIWHFLAVVAYPDFVRWRWSNAKIAHRFLGTDNDQTFSRLWLASDLLRNGSDYSAVTEAMRKQDIISTLMALKLFHNRAVAIALSRYVISNGLTSDEIQILSKRLRAAAMTRLVDELAPIDSLLDNDAFYKWIGDAPRADDLIRDDLPVDAPGEAGIPSSLIDAITALLLEVAPPDILRHSVKGTGYLLLRSDSDSYWNDQDGISYHFGAKVPNNKLIKPGVRAIIVRSEKRKKFVIGVATIGNVSTDRSGKDATFTAEYAEYTELAPTELDDGEAGLTELPNYNRQYSINFIPEEIFSRIRQSHKAPQMAAM